MALDSGLFGPVVQRTVDPDLNDTEGVGTVWVNIITGECFIASLKEIDVPVWRGPFGNDLEVPVEISFPLADPLVASADTHLTPAYEYKKPWVVAARRLGAWYVKFDDNVGGNVTLKLKKNGIDVANASVTILSGASESLVDQFTEFTMVVADTLEVEQTTARVDGIQAVVYIYGYERVVRAGDII